MRKPRDTREIGGVEEANFISLLDDAIGVETGILNAFQIA